MTYQILVIGSGASGLMAACHLIEKKHSVTIIEARNRTGGRIHTWNTDFSLPLETGAEFIHGKQPVTMSVAKKSKSEVSLMNGKRYQIQHGQQVQGDFFGDQWGKLIDALKKIETDMDIASFLNRYFDEEQYRALYEKVKGFVEGYDAADMHRVSAMALKKEWAENDEEHQYHIRGGYGRLIHYLEKTFKSSGGSIVFSSPVNEIQRSSGKVKVVTEQSQVFEADKVLITIPLGVLQRGTIRFTPSPEEHFQAFNQMGYGGVIKFFFEFKQDFWQDCIKKPLKDFSFIFSDAEVPTWWSQLPDKTPLLTGWLGGPSTFKITHDAEALFKKAIASLEYLFGCPSADIMKAVRAWHIADWVEDPFASGAYAYPTIETKKAHSILSQPIANTLYFAGEALYEGPAIGTVEAALISGLKVSGKIEAA